MRNKKWFQVMLVSLLCLIGWCFFQVWQSYHMLGTNEMEIIVEDVNVSEIRIAVLADLHDVTHGDQNGILIEKTLAQDPDFILMCGDMLNRDQEDISALLTLVQELSVHVPVYYAWWNRELVYMESHPELPQLLTEAGAVILEEDYKDIDVNGQMIRVGGLYAYAFFSDQEIEWKQMSFAQQNAYDFLNEFQDTENCKVLMCHRPDSFIFRNAAELWDVDLVVSGHTHGGQIVIPFLGGLWAPDQGWFPEYVCGLHSLGQIQLAITTGLGAQKSGVPRFNNPPEILLLRLRAEN